jgi:hypothetical protein
MQKSLKSPFYNFTFDTETGHFMRWGMVMSDDPQYSPFGPEILDLEIGTICNGIPKAPGTPAVPCAFCYKSNTKSGTNMSFETFKNIFDKMPKTLTQIAFGIGDIDSNPDMVKMWEYCRKNDHNPEVIPNVTINGHGLTDEWVSTLKSHCGAVAVSAYDPKDVCYDAVQKLTDTGMSQINIHMLVANESFERCKQTIIDASTDSRLAKLNAIVFLTMKPKGKRNEYTVLKDVSKYRELIELAEKCKVRFGFDSCTAPSFLTAMKDRDNFKQLDQMAESCESSLFSSYINVKGEYWHCSFTEGQPGWKGVSVLDADDFLNDVWMHEETVRFREGLTCQKNHHISSSCRLCPVFDLYDEKVKG